MKNPTTTTEPPIVSIVVPAYNASRFMPETIASIQAQTLRAWECIIVDDGSKDNTLALVRSLTAGDPRFRTVTQPNAGPSAARGAHGRGRQSQL